MFVYVLCAAQCPGFTTSNGQPCDDGLVSTRADTCFNGVCSGVQCPNDPQYNNLPCDDGNYRTVGDRCLSGTCTGVPGAAQVPPQCH